MKTILKQSFDFGKISFRPTKRRCNRVIVNVYLREVETYVGVTYIELSMSAEVWNTRDTNVIIGGQCLDEILKYKEQLNNPQLFDELYAIWNRWHLNGMRPGTSEQMRAVDECLSLTNKYDYDEICKMLEGKGLLIVNYTGFSKGHIYDNEPYKYGSDWLVEPLPKEVIETVKKLSKKYGEF